MLEGNVARDVYEALIEVQNKETFLKFMKELAKDFDTNPQEWDSITINAYLNGVQSWVHDMDGDYMNTGQEVPKDINWNFIAVLFYVGKIYD